MKTLALLPFVFCVACGGAPFQTEINNGKETGTLFDSQSRDDAGTTNADAGSVADTNSGVSSGDTADAGTLTGKDAQGTDSCLNKCGYGYVCVYGICEIPTIPCAPSLIEQCANVGDGCQETDAGAVCVH